MANREERNLPVLETNFNVSETEKNHIETKSLDKMKLSILEYMKYLGGSKYSKCVVEGENVLNAGHLILAGKTEENLENVTINGLCLQSSSLESVPHEITGELSLGRS
ncbi:hypothetical protein NQ317_000065 [Molorchus minor]|uniref:Uncharacterized protein n=1 Tax=Molorchus minor TaxID=1323400 RepID=A0ABQ9JHZ1_9CUCU|nr:hypothetical protein NQ317_000065 [Molorchus minor]